MSRLLTTILCLLGLLITPCLAQTAPDIIIPSGHLDGAYLVTDRNSDGVYNLATETYDFIIEGLNTSSRIYAQQGTRIFYNCTILDQIRWGSDDNNDGFIRGKEIRTFFDAFKNFGPTACELNSITFDSAGWLWWANDGGDKEGIYRSKDLNSDGDAEDAGETIAVLVEPTTVTVANAPLTGANTLAVTAIDSVFYDPIVGRFLSEDENFDQTLAFHDKNKDGDFGDPGEVYIFCALYNGGTLVKDINPDVTSLVLPSANEIRHFAVDPVAKAYYLASSDSTGTDACKIFRGVDKNLDGDINDAGEVTIYWDGSLTSTGATKGYNFIYGMHLYKGLLYVSAEWEGGTGPDHERLLVMQDNNKDGDVNDVGEIKVLWDFPLDKSHYAPLVLAPGTVKIPTGLPGTSNYFGTSLCATSLSTTSFHNIMIGKDNWTDKPILGDSTFHIRTWGVAPAGAGLFAMGLSKFPTGIPLDVGNTCFLFINPALVLMPFNASATGEWDQPLPIPNNSGLIGVWTYWQSAVLDATATAGLGYTISDGLEIRMGTHSYTPNP